MGKTLTPLLLGALAGLLVGAVWHWSFSLLPHLISPLPWWYSLSAGTLAGAFAGLLAGVLAPEKETTPLVVALSSLAALVASAAQEHNPWVTVRPWKSKRTKTNGRQCRSGQQCAFCLQSRTGFEETPIIPMIAVHGHLTERCFGRSDEWHVDFSCHVGAN
jgi:hypothetical protein